MRAFAGCLLLGLCSACTPQYAGPPSPTPAPAAQVPLDKLFPSPAPATGRYQIMNGTPELTRNIMLLDTWTGDTWIICGNKDGPTGWCVMDRDYEQAKASR